MKHFDHIALIFNPNSTGDAAEMAHELRTDINKNYRTIKCKATLTPTERAMHAHELARDLSLKYKHPLIISISGDGGYNEVINGVMDAQEQSKEANPVVAVVAAGNANDHQRMTRGETDLIDLIIKNSPQPLDLLKLSTDSKKITRYAHSYIGLGISPKVGYELNKLGKSTLTEAITLLKTFWSFKPFTIISQSKRRRLDSIVFANISEMAKVLKLEPETDVTNNKFRVVEFPHQNKLQLLFRVLKAVFLSTKSNMNTSEYEFQTIHEELVQFDGEIESIEPGTTVQISSHPAAISSLY